MEKLPEGCISHILSLTTPRDACRSSVISSGFRSAAVSDTVWERFLPHDYRHIISTSISPLVFSTKKDLYFRLCPTLLDGGTKSFALDTMSGKKCYMIGARELSIAWGDTPRYWTWTSLPESRFLEVAQLLCVWWLDIQGKMETRLLSPNTTYAAYFVFMLAGNSHGLHAPTKVSVKFLKAGEVGNEAGGDEKTVYLQSQGWIQAPQQQDGQLPRERGDGWMEIEMGEFFSGQDDGEVEMRLREIEVLSAKSGLIVQGKFYMSLGMKSSDWLWAPCDSTLTSSAFTHFALAMVTVTQANFALPTDKNGFCSFC